MSYRSFCPRVVYHIIHADGIDTTEISDSIGFKECPILTLPGLGSALRLLPVKTERRVNKSWFYLLSVRPTRRPGASGKTAGDILTLL